MQSQRGLLHDETPARQVGKHPVHWRNGAGQAILDSHQGEIGQSFPDVVQGSTAAQGVVQEVQRRELDLTTVLGGLRKIGIPLKIQGTARKSHFVDAVKQDIAMLGVTPDSPDPILVRKGLPKHGFPRGSCGEGDKVRVQDGVEIHCPSKYSFVRLI